MTIRAKLPTGKLLQFPKGTPQEVIERTVKRVMGVDTGPSATDILNENLSKFLEGTKHAQGSGVTRKEASAAFHEAAKSYGKTLQKLLSEVNTDNQEKVSKLVQALEAAHENDVRIFAQSIRAAIKAVTDENAKGLKAFSKALGAREVEIAKIANTLTRKTDTLHDAVESFRKQNDQIQKRLEKLDQTISQSVQLITAALTAPKTLTHDASGKLTGVKVINAK